MPSISAREAKVKMATVGMNRVATEGKAMSIRKIKSRRIKQGTLRPPRIPALALRADEAAMALGISRSLLGEWTKAGIIPHLRQGGVVMYSVPALRRWLALKEDKDAGGEGPVSGT